ncbi:putative mitochondrial protein [Tanacetum coccineum]
MRCAVEEEEEQVIARFLGALRADIADVCQRLGHYSQRRMPKQTASHNNDDEAPVYDTKNEDDMVKETDELVYADQGEALVTQRVLNADVVKTGEAFSMEYYKAIILTYDSMPKGGKFKWTMEADSAFAELKKQVTEAPVLALPNFDEVFQVECDASLGLYQYSTYDKEFYAIVRSLDYWRHYLLSNEFIPLLRP